jgi:hypothetical protein
LPRTAEPPASWWELCRCCSLAWLEFPAHKGKNVQMITIGTGARTAHTTETNGCSPHYAAARFNARRQDKPREEGIDRLESWATDWWKGSVPANERANQLQLGAIWTPPIWRSGGRRRRRQSGACGLEDVLGEEAARWYILCVGAAAAAGSEEYWHGTETDTSWLATESEYTSFSFRVRVVDLYTKLRRVSTKKKAIHGNGIPKFTNIIKCFY